MLPLAAAASAVLTFVGIALTSASAARVIAIVGIIVTGACLRAWVLIRRSQ